MLISEKKAICWAVRSAEKKPKNFPKFPLCDSGTDKIPVFHSAYNKKRSLGGLLFLSLKASLKRHQPSYTQAYTRPKGAWKKADGQIKRKECDIIVANGTEAVIVEVKTTLTPKNVRDFLETLQNFKRYFTRFDSEIIYGAVAYLAIESRADVLAEKEGLFLIRATGDSASLANDESFKPKVFA